MAETDEVQCASESHDGVLYGIRHPGPAEGCPYCVDTLKQKHLIDSWAAKDALANPPVKTNDSDNLG